VRRPVDGVSDATLAQAREFVAARKPILAVKVVRAETGWSLKDAKEFVDRLRQNP
jgi:ribosomal protein L7/L12